MKKSFTIPLVSLCDKVMNIAIDKGFNLQSAETLANKLQSKLETTEFTLDFRTAEENRSINYDLANSVCMGNNGLTIKIAKLLSKYEI